MWVVEVKKLFYMIVVSVFIMPIMVNARRGCCSHHGGVAGCSSSGRQICADRTLSPTCTCSPGYNNSNVSSYTYGCTDSNAFNYNPSANRDDGSCIAKKYGCMDKNAINYDGSVNVEDSSCQYKKTITETEIVEYETKQVKNNKLLKGKTKQYRKGINGKKEITYDAVVNKDGNVISKVKKEEKIIEEAIEEVIEIGTKEETNPLSVWLWIIALVISFIYFFRCKNGNLILHKIKKQHLLVQIILYPMYILFIIPPFIDAVIVIINIIKNKF